MTDGTKNHTPFGEPEKESPGQLLGDATALQRMFKAEPALVKLIISNQGFLEALFAHPVSFRTFLQTDPAQDNLDHLLSSMALGGDGATVPGPRHPQEVRLAVLLRDPQAAAFFREQPELAEILLRNPTFAEQVKVRRPQLYKALLDKAQQRFGSEPEMARLIANERAGIIDFTVDGQVLETPQRRATRENSLALFEAAKNGDTKAARLLIDNRADLNAKDDWQRTPLHWASAKGHTELAKLLIDNGADLEAKDNLGHTPLHDAVENGHTEVARLLLSMEAKVNAKNDWQRTPLHLAALGGHTELAKLFIDNRADLTAKDHWQRTPLHWAAYHGHAEIVRRLIDAGADPNARNDRGQTPLHFVAQKGHTETVHRLIDGGADLNAKDEQHRTPWRYAVEAGHADLAGMLQPAAERKPGFAGRIAEKQRGNDDEPQVGG